MHLVFNQDGEHVHEKHISWFTKKDIMFEGDFIGLYEVVEKYYPHPDAPKNAVVPVLETRLVASFKRCQFDAAALVILEAAMNTVSTIFKDQMSSTDRYDAHKHLLKE